MLPLLFLKLLEEYKTNPDRQIVHAVKQSGLQWEDLLCYVDRRELPRYFIRRNNAVTECSEKEAGLVCVLSYIQHDLLSIPDSFRRLSDVSNTIIDYSTTFGMNESLFFATFGSVITSFKF